MMAELLFTVGAAAAPASGEDQDFCPLRFSIDEIDGSLQICGGLETVSAMCVRAMHTRSPDRRGQVIGMHLRTRLVPRCGRVASHSAARHRIIRGLLGFLSFKRVHGHVYWLGGPQWFPATSDMHTSMPGWSDAAFTRTDKLAKVCR